VLQLYSSQIMDGFLVAPQDVQSHKALFDRIQGDGFPFVFIDRYVTDVSATRISSDHFTIACNLTEGLIEKGHRRIVFVRRLNEPENSTIRSRMEGYRKTMESRGLKAEYVGFVFEGEERSDLAERLGELSASAPPPEAIFLSSGFYMPHLLQACGRSGYDLSQIDFVTVDSFVLPFDFIQEKKLIHGIGGNLTVVIQDTQLIARQAVDTLIALVNGQVDKKERKYIPVELRQI